MPPLHPHVLVRAPVQREQRHELSARGWSGASPALGGLLVADGCRSRLPVLLARRAHALDALDTVSSDALPSAYKMLLFVPVPAPGDRNQADGGIPWDWQGCVPRKRPVSRAQDQPLQFADIPSIPVHVCDWQTTPADVQVRVSGHHMRGLRTAGPVGGCVRERRELKRPQTGFAIEMVTRPMRPKRPKGQNGVPLGHFRCDGQRLSLALATLSTGDYHSEPDALGCQRTMRETGQCASGNGSTCSTSSSQYP